MVRWADEFEGAGMLYYERVKRVNRGKSLAYISDAAESCSVYVHLATLPC